MVKKRKAKALSHGLSVFHIFANIILFYDFFSAIKSTGAFYGDRKKSYNQFEQVINELCM